MSLNKNIVVNFLGQGWVALMNIVFLPLYINYLGVEAYGLIGIFAMLQVWFGVLDMGITPTLNREMARYTAGENSIQSIRDLLRSFEIISVALALVTVTVIWICAGWISVDWLKVEKLSPEVTAQAIQIIGFVIALRIIESIFKGAILGLQKQVYLNIASSILATLRAVGSIFVLEMISPTIEAFFIWQGLISVVTVSIFILAVYQFLPPIRGYAKFSFVQLKKIWRFSSGILMTTIAVILLTQIDKVILSHVLSLESFGYYTLACTVSAFLYVLVGPITQACYPSFTKMVSMGSKEELINAYHESAQIATILMVPATLMLFLFGEKFLTHWTGNPELSSRVAPILGVMALGTMLNCLMHIPYQLTLAYGWASFGARLNIVAAIFFVPAILWFAPKYGAIGAAWVWVVLNSCYVLISIYFIHARLMPNEMWQWYLCDVIFPSIGAFIMAVIFWLIKPSLAGDLAELIWILTGGLAMVIMSAMLAPLVRKRILTQISFN